MVNNQQVLFLTQVYARYKPDEITAEIIMKMFQKKFKDEEVESIFGENTEYDFLRRVCPDICF